MYPTSAAFLTAVRQSHLADVVVQVTQPDGALLAEITPDDGDVTADAARSTRRECSLLLPDYVGSLVPASAGDLLSPLSGNELRPWRGVNGEMIPLGVFPIRQAPAQIDQDGVPKVQVTARDRSSTVSRNQWTDVFPIASGTALEDAIGRILQDRAPLYDFDLPVTGITVPAITLGLNTANDPWADAVALAASAGYDLTYDVTGVAVMTQPVDPTTATPVLYYTDDENSVQISAGKEWDADLGFNGCIVIGEGNGAVAGVRGEAWDDDEDSPTYYLGPYGKYPEIIVTPLVTTVGQANAYAVAQLTRRRGAAQRVVWDQLVNPALDVYDAVAFANSDLRISTALVVVIDSLKIPLAPGGAMSATTRTRQVAL